MLLDTLSSYLNSSNPVVAVDLNNTIMNQQAGLVRLSKGRLSLSDFSEWDKDLSGKMEMSKDQYLQWAWANSYAEKLSPPFPGAAQSLQQIKNAGIAIWIVTASNMTDYEIEWWLNWNLIPFDQIFKCSDKTWLGREIPLIDDSPATCKRFYDAGLSILRYELDWNRHLAHIPAVRWAANRT